jgi:hypothetical protein
MVEFVDWFGPSLAALVFLTLGVLKLVGLRRGLVGGRDKPLLQYVCGTCPAWRGGPAWVTLPLVLLAVGIVNLGLAVMALRGR